MQTNGWKPGPPPLDTPGRYDLVLVGLRRVVEVKDGEYLDEQWEPMGRHWMTRCTMHYPIPDPPETET